MMMRRIKRMWDDDVDEDAYIMMVMVTMIMVTIFDDDKNV